MDGDVPPVNLDFEGVAGALASRRAVAACQVCGENEWRPMGQLGNLIATLPLATLHAEPLSTPDGERGVLPVYVLTCWNCGFVRLHSTTVVNEAATEATDEPQE